MASQGCHGRGSNKKRHILKTIRQTWHLTLKAKKHQPPDVPSVKLIKKCAQYHFKYECLQRHRVVSANKQPRSMLVHLAVFDPFLAHSRSSDLLGWFWGKEYLVEAWY